MDLVAYMQIEDLRKIAKDNGIDVPRLRGYRLMKNQEPIPQEEIERRMKDDEIYIVEQLCESEPFWNPNSNISTYSSYTDYLKDFFLVKKLDEEKRKEYVGIRWNRIHGWKRRILKFEIKKQRRRTQKQCDLWNKYAGRDDVLYIHSRMGGNNWKYYEGKNKLENQPWFLDRVDDSFDSTYCDFYAKIKVDGGDA